VGEFREDVWAGGKGRGVRGSGEWEVLINQ
jgi:hypothetical protein